MCWLPRPTARSSPRSPESCTCPRARSATTCRPASRRPGPATAPRPCTSPRNAAGSEWPPPPQPVTQPGGTGGWHSRRTPRPGFYDTRVPSAGYLRYPHLHEDLLTFVADDDVWLAPAAGGQAWRLSAQGGPGRHPPVSPDSPQGAVTP